MNWKTQLARILDPHSFELFDRRRAEYDASVMLIRERDDIISQLKEELLNVKSDVVNCKLKISELQDAHESPIDEFYGTLFSEIPNITYKDKRRIDGVWVPCRLNSLIQPRMYWAVKLNSMTKATIAFNRAQYIGEYIARNTTWFDEIKEYSTKDRYLFIDEVLGGLNKKADCEDMSAAMVSCMPDRCGLVFGYFHNKKQNITFGHCWVEFIDDNSKVWIIELTYKDVEIYGKDDDMYSWYEPILCVTQDKTYKRSQKNVQFGIKI